MSGYVGAAGSQGASPYPASDTNAPTAPFSFLFDPQTGVRPTPLPTPAQSTGQPGLPPFVRLPGALALPLMLYGDTPRPRYSVEGENGVSGQLSDDGRHITLSVQVGWFGQKALTTLTIDRDEEGRPTGTLSDGQGHVLGQLTPTPDGGRITLDPQAAGQLDARVKGEPEPDAAQSAETTTTDRCAPEPPDQTVGPFTRNTHLPPALQADPFRARGMAYASDAQLRASGLQPQGATPGDCAQWRAHHLIPVKQIAEYDDVLRAAAQDGWSVDEANNILGLPLNPQAQARLAAVGSLRPLHDNAHQTDYSTGVAADLEDIRTALRESGLTKGTPEYNQLAHRLVEAEEAKLRASLLAMGMGRVTQAEPSTSDHAA
jgi:hypothetical protein